MRESASLDQASHSWLARLSHRVADWRNQRLMDPRFHRWAARFPLTRPIAARRASQLFDLVAGFVYSQILYACVQGRVFDLLAGGPRPLRGLAHDMQLDETAAEVLLDGAVALNLLERRSNSTFALGPLGAPLVGNKPILSMIEHHAALYADLRDPLALLQKRSFDTALAQYWPYTPAHAASVHQASGQVPDPLTVQVAAYSSLMAASQPFVADEVLEAIDFSTFKTVLDVGGGEGAFLCRLAKSVSQPQLILFDLPPVAARAQVKFAQAGLQHRAVAKGGSFLTDALPTGADCITLLRVLHDHDDPQAMQILRAIRAALPASGRLVLAEPMAQTPGAQASGHAYFGMYLWAMGRGRSRSAAKITSMLIAAGFTHVKEHRSAIALQARILTAK
jgi:demethylspheroidene O-methyltransferase